MSDDPKDERDKRAAQPPADDGAPEPEPGEDGGPMGNPAQDEEALSHGQEEASED